MNAPIIARRTASSICLSCRRSLLRQFSSAQRLAFPEFQSYRLNPQPPSPPRSAAGPDTSITHPTTPHLPRVHETRPPPSLGANSWTSVREEAAQKSQPEFARPQSSTPASPQTEPTSQSEPAKSATTAPTMPAEPTAPKPRPRSKLRAPRKAALKLTPAAVDHLRALLDQPDPKLIKVGVRNRGCSGLAYHLEYIDKPGAFDEAVEQDGVKVLIDSKALFSIIGSEMDWVEDKLNQRFVFRNPNIMLTYPSLQRSNAVAANPSWFRTPVMMKKLCREPRRQKGLENLDRSADLAATTVEDQHQMHRNGVR
ncbi:Iron-sulfur assembly protein 1 [Diaporthe australafricana]|uniref:Iron-sulfur assembly protein 1 n=1 Tax=Diaporthe australafricana TaxID=127596 RepID=A0ABR3W7W1_9PEZI